VTEDAEAIVADLGGRRRGIVRTDLALKAGVTVHDLRNLRRRRGLLISVGRGVDRLRDRPFDWESRCQAALDLAGDGAVLARRSAARLHGFWAYRDTEAIEVAVRRGRDHDTTLGRVIQTRWLPADHVTTVDGLPVTTPARTFFDLCGDPDGGLRLDHPAHERAMARVYNDAVARRGMTFVQEAAVLVVLAKRGRAGTRLVRRLLERFGPDHTPTQSDAESLFVELIDAYQLPEPQRQVPISDSEGWIGTVDFLWPSASHVVEVDSAWHDGPLDREQDRERDDRLRAAGYTVARYRYGDFISRPAAVARELGVAIGHIDR
jgi:very-short-patch-repair endonuclease